MEEKRRQAAALPKGDRSFTTRSEPSVVVRRGGLLRIGILIGFLVRHHDPTPLFFVSVASKEFSHTVSLLFATVGLC
jgi:hypothetical protein